MKVQIPLAFGHRNNKFRLFHHHITTQDFGTFTPVLFREMVPGDSFNAQTRSFARLQPLPVPTFADIRLQTYAFYCPWRLLWKDGQAFFTHQKCFDGASSYDPTVPAFGNDIWVNALTKPNFCSTVSNTDNWDFHVGSNYYKLDFLGKRVYSALVGLGYNFNFSTSDTEIISLLPLLGYVKCIHEYLYPAAAYPDYRIDRFFSHTSKEIDGWSDTEKVQFLADIFQALPKYSFLDDDYINSAWRFPNGNGSQDSLGTQWTESDIRILTKSSGDEGSMTSIVYNKSTQTPNLTVPSTSSGITQMGLNLLQAVTNYVTRNAVAGNKTIDRWLARFGVKLPNLVLQRPVFLGKQVQPVYISDVMANATVDGGSRLGDYAGKGVSTGDAGHFNYESDEYGGFFLISFINPVSGVVKGRKREVLHNDYDEFYLPEFDCIGPQGIRNDEVMTFKDGTKYDSGTSYGTRADGIFGYAPRYSEYKSGFNNLSGDFITKSREVALESYHLFRSFPEDQVGNSTRPIKLTPTFLSSSPWTQYNRFNRIFQSSENDFDHFVCEYTVDITAYRPMHQIGETLDLEDVHGEGRKVTVDYNGSQA